MVILVLLKLRTGLSIKVLQYQQEERGPGWTPAILRVGISSLISSSTCWRECNITALLSEDYRHRPSVKIREFIIFCIYYVLACVLCDRATVKKSPSFKTRDRSILHLRAITTIKNRMQKAEVRLSEAFHPSIRSNNFYSLLSWRLKNEGTFFFSTRQFIPVHRSAVQCRDKKKKKVNRVKWGALLIGPVNTDRPITTAVRLRLSSIVYAVERHSLFQFVRSSVLVKYCVFASAILRLFERGSYFHHFLL